MPVESLERRYLLATYSPGGDGLIGSLDFAGGTLASDDRVVIDFVSNGGTQQDVFNVTGATTLGGLLDLNGMDLGGLAAGDVFPIVTTTGAGSLSGAFHAVSGLEGTAGLDVAVIQGPSGISLVATSLPTGDFTIAADDTSDFNDLVAFFSSGTAASPATVTDAAVHFLGQRIAGDLELSYAAAEQALGIEALDRVNPADAGRLVLQSAGVNLVTFVGGGLFTVGERGSETSGLRIGEDGFTAQEVTIGSVLGGEGSTISRLGNGKIGPLTFDKFEGFLAEGGLVFDAQTLDAAVGFRAESASLDFTKSDGSAPADGNKGVTAEVGFPELAINLEASYDVGAGSLSELSPDGGFSGYVSDAELAIPGLFTARANYNIEFGYDPNGDSDQTLFAAGELELQLANLPVYGKISQGNFSLDYAFTLRQNGFEFANFEIGINTDDGTGADTGNSTIGPVKFGTAVTIHDPKVIFSDFAYTYGETADLAGTSVSLAASQVDIGPESGNFGFTGTEVRATLELGENGIPSGFQFRASSLSLSLGRYFTASATNIVFHPTADAGEDLLLVNGSISAGLNLNSLPGVDALQLTGTMSRFSVLEDGTFNPLEGFAVGFGIDVGLTKLLGGIEFPSFFSVGGSGKVTIAWPDFNAEPDRFVMMLSASVDLSFGGASPIELHGEFNNLAIDTRRLDEGQFPIIGVESVAIGGSAEVFGGDLDAELILGTVLFDDQGSRLNYSSALMLTPDLIAESVFYAGVEGGFTIADKGGFKLMMGLSELGPLMAYVRADVPILLDPNTGLTIDEFRGGITFNATAFPDITDPVDLRSSIFQPTRNLDRDQWMTQLQNLVVNQKGGNPGFLFNTTDDWTGELNAGWVPETGDGRTGLRERLTEYGYALSKIAGVIEVTPLEAGVAWLVDDRGTQFLITRGATGVFTVSSIGFNIGGDWIAELPTGATTQTAGNTSLTTGEETLTLVDIFAEAGIGLDPAAIVSETESGVKWEVVHDGVTFNLTVHGDDANGERRLIVTGGNGTFGALDQVIKIEAGATFYSQYTSKNFFKVETDIIFTTDGNMLFAGDASWLTDPATEEPTFQQSTRIYLNFEDLEAGTGKIFYLTDIPFDPTDATAGSFAAHGVVSFGFLDSLGNPVTDRTALESGTADSFEISLAGSETQGLAVVNLAGFQRFRLGGKFDPESGIQYGQATLNISGTQITFDYSANISAEGLIAADSVIRSAGKFVLDFEDDFELWGAAILEASTEQIDPLRIAGISGEAKAQIQINTSDIDRQVALEVPGEGSRTLDLEEESFGLFLGGALVFEPAIAGGVVHQEIVGAFAIQGSSQDGFSLLVLGSMPVPLPLVGAIASPLQADLLGALVIDDDGIAGKLELTLREDLLPAGYEQYFDFSVGLGLYFNSTGLQKEVVIPPSLSSFLEQFLPDELLHELSPPTQGSESLTVQISAGAPRADGGFEDDGGYFVLMGDGLLTVADTFELDGSFRIAYRHDIATSTNFFEFEADATLELAPLGSITARGMLVMEDDAGDLTGLNVYGAFQLSGAIDVGPLSFDAYAALEFNSHDTPRTINRYYDPVTRTASDTAIPTEIGDDTLQVFIGGNLQWSGATIVKGAFTFIKSSDVLTMAADAVVDLDPLATVAVSGFLELSSDGIVGLLEIASNIDFDIVTLSGVASIEFNTYDEPRQVNRYYDVVNKQAVATPIPTNIPAGTLRFFVGGEISIGPIFTLNGSVEIVNNPQKLSMVFDTELRAFFDVLTIDVDGSAEIYKGSDAGLVLDFNLNNLNFGVEDIFEVGAENVSLRINTRNTPTTSALGHSLEGNSLELNIGSIGVEIFSAFTFTGSGAFKIVGSFWQLNASLSTNFFDVAYLSGDVMFRSNGEFKFDVYGGFNLGAGGTGIFGNGELHVSYLASNAASTTVLSSNDLRVSGKARVEGKLFDIPLGAIDVSFRYDANDGELWTRACVEFWRPFEDDEICVDFTIGFIKVPPPIYLASNADDTAGRDFRGGALHLNIGDRFLRRNFAAAIVNEPYYIEAVGPGSEYGQRIRIVGLGRTQEFDNVTSIHGNGGSGSDHIEISNGVGTTGVDVSVPVNLSGGAGNDRIEHYGAGAATLRGGGGHDVLISGASAALLEGEAGSDQIHGGGGVDTISGGADDDIVFWSAGDSADASITGGEGENDALFVRLGTGDDNLLVDRTAGQFRLKRLTSGGTLVEAVTATSGFETLDVDTGTGPDNVTFKPLAGANLGSVRVRLGGPVPGATMADGAGSTPDSQADFILIEGRAGADAFVLSNPETDTTQISHTGVTTFTLYGTTRGAGDGVEVDAGGGNDTLDASALNRNLLAVSLTGGTGNDSLVGSRYNDHLDSGAGNDTVTGGRGTDTFADAGGTDTLIEDRDADMTITSDTLVVGSLSGTSTYAAAAEFERINGIFETAHLTGGAGANTLTVGDDDGVISHGGNSRSVANTWIPTINLDGASGGDHYVARLSNSGNAVVNVSDSGAAADGSDRLTMHGTAEADQFLLRSSFVTGLAGGDAQSGFTTAERVNYGQDIEGGLTVNGRDGDDHFASDDTGTRATLNGGLGRDFFQIGQMFEADRLPPHVAAGDEVMTTLTTVGYLTNGVSHEVTANGDDGEDSFVVFRNKATLRLNGGAGNDSFTVRAFALAGSGTYDSSQTEIGGGSGDDTVDYAINALVAVNGGTGFDRVRVLGTEFGDHFIVTDEGVQGAGLTVSYDEVEALEVHGGDGNDRFNVMSTGAAVATYLFGGAGSDRFFVTDSVDDPAYADHVRSLSNIQGPLIIDGAPGEPGVFDIPAPVMFRGESDLPDGAGGHSSDGSHSGVELAGDVDIIDIVDVDAVTDDVGTLTDERLWGLGMGGDLTQEVNPGEFETIDGGITYANSEIMEIQLGSGSETLNVLSIARMTTLIKGNAGDDTFNVSAAAVAEAMLVIYGDGAASGTHREVPGNDRIDARLSSHGAIYYGGAGNDTILGGSDADRIAGGSGNDSLGGEGGSDLIWGDSGFDVDRTTRITTVVTGGKPGEDDFASTGDDTIHAGSGTDVAFGDHGQVQLVGGAANVLAESGVVDRAQTIERNLGGHDTMTASGAGDSYLFGGTGSDNISGGDGNDAILGDHGRIEFNLDGDPATFDLVAVLDTHIGSGDALAGGTGNDLILGQAGSDTISGGAGNDVVIGDNATVRRAGGTLLEHDLRQRYGLHDGGTLYKPDGSPNLAALGEGDSLVDPLGVPHLSVALIEHAATTPDDGRFGADSLSGDAGNDVMFGQRGNDTLDGGLGDDYVEGNGGDDFIRGGIGQDMLIGGSSDRFGLSAADRFDGSDRIYGGDGTRIGRDDAGDLSTSGHASDADFILGDNANAFIVLDLSTGTFVRFNHDNYDPTRIMVRAVELLEYTPGIAQPGDHGAGDVLHGEDGDDSIWGMTGGDALFGGGNDDDLIGGNGPDWISGGAGDDGILGDDGFIKTSRNGLAEPLYGIAALTGSQLNETIRTPGGMQQATIHLGGKLKKEVDLEPFDTGDDDIVYGGLGHDSIHGGAGDDALSGAEALPTFYGRALAFADQPINPGDVLRFGHFKDGEFADYDEYEPRKRIEGHLLNFDAAEDDGDDAIFGDEGNDWMVGGRGSDRLYGGRGNDLLNVDDDMGTNGGLNDQPDGGQLVGADLAYGGAGRDVLIANAEDDRLIDWVGEFNSYIVPFAPFGARTISRALLPQLPEFLLKLATSDGLDLTRTDPNAPERMGEPNGELGMVRQQDPDWREQTGAPDDPQPGNVGGGKRDVVATESFDSTMAASRFGPDSGAWSIEDGGYIADYGGDTISVMFLEDELPAYFEIQATARADKAKRGQKANAYLLFDYRSATDFKFAGINDANDQVVIGQRTAAGWEVLNWSNLRMRDGDLQLLKVVINGATASLLVNNTLQISHAFERRLDDGMIGLGVDNSRTRFDNVEVLTLPPATTWSLTESFGSGDGGFATATGSTSISDGVLRADAAGDEPSIAIRSIGASANSYLEFHADVQVSAGGFGGLVFDYYSPTDFKYVAYDAAAHRLVIGHRTARGWVTDATHSLGDAGLGRLGLAIRGTTVSVMMDGDPLFGHVYNSALADGAIGVFARTGSALFDDLFARGDDPNVVL